MRAAGFPCGGWIRVWIIISFFLPSFPCAVSIDFNFNNQLVSPKRGDEALGNTSCFVRVFI